MEWTDALFQLGTAVFAVTGVLAAARQNMDVMSFLVIGVVTAVGGGTLARVGLRGLLRDGRVSSAGGLLELTPRGRDDAKQLVRTHRLWEAYLVQYLGLPLDHVHEPAHRVEHYITPDIREELEHKLDATDVDPHGREIPS